MFILVIDADLNIAHIATSLQNETQDTNVIEEIRGLNQRPLLLLSSFLPNNDKRNQ